MLTDGQIERIHKLNAAADVYGELEQKIVEEFFTNDLLFCSVGKSGIIRQCNLALVNCLSFTATQLKSRTWWGLTRGDEIEKLILFFAGLSVDSQTVDLHWLTRNGSYKPVGWCAFRWTKLDFAYCFGTCGNV